MRRRTRRMRSRMRRRTRRMRIKRKRQIKMEKRIEITKNLNWYR